uniref:Putative ovule protein n=1 Tax=Solanum chacoense TaxID=4108 RepID=A0A0V0H6F7_SOLCH
MLGLGVLFDNKSLNFFGLYWFFVGISKQIIIIILNFIALKKSNLVFQDVVLGSFTMSNIFKFFSCILSS